MRAFDPAFAEHIESGATTLATCWLIVRSDGVRLGFTDHDGAIGFGGDVFEPATGLDGTDRRDRLGAQVDTGEVAGILSHETIGAKDIRLGRFDGARVETWRVNWRDPDIRALLRVDTIGEIVEEDGAFRAELRSPQHALNVPKGRTYQALCSAQLGDAACGVGLETPALRASATIVAIADRHRLTVMDLSGFAEGWFGFGTAIWTSGKRSGIKDRIMRHTRSDGVDTLSFEAAVGETSVPGDSLLVYAGCDRRLSVCRDKFANAVNFRGFPHIPGNDYMLRYPRKDAALDGQPIVR